MTTLITRDDSATRLFRTPVSGAVPGAPFEAEVKIRYKSAPAAAIVEPLADGRVLVRFFEPQHAISPGQVACFYDGDRLLAGGLISKESARAAAPEAAAAV